MNFAACEHPHKPCVYSSEPESASFGLLSCTRYVLEYPVDLGGAEVGVDDESCLAADGVNESFLPFKSVTEIRCPSVLPYDCVVYRFACLCIPDDGGLTLVCDADACDVAAVDADRGYRFSDDRSL